MIRSHTTVNLCGASTSYVLVATRTLCYVDGMKLTPSQLRANIYKILDQVLDSGQAVEVVRNGRVLRIVADRPPAAGGRLRRLTKRKSVLNCDFDDIVHLDWSSQWRP